jgi:hypothetical protein
MPREVIMRCMAKASALQGAAHLQADAMHPAATPSSCLQHHHAVAMVAQLASSGQACLGVGVVNDGYMSQVSSSPAHSACLCCQEASAQ